MLRQTCPAWLGAAWPSHLAATRTHLALRLCQISRCHHFPIYAPCLDWSFPFVRHGSCSNESSSTAGIPARRTPSERRAWSKTSTIAGLLMQQTSSRHYRLDLWPSQRQHDHRVGPCRFFFRLGRSSWLGPSCGGANGQKVATQRESERRASVMENEGLSVGFDFRPWPLIVMVRWSAGMVRVTASWRKVLAVLDNAEQETPCRYPCYRVANVRS